MRGRPTNRLRGARIAFDQVMQAMGDDLPLFPELALPLPEVIQWLDIAQVSLSVIAEEERSTSCRGNAPTVTASGRNALAEK